MDFPYLFTVSIVASSPTHIGRIQLLKSVLLVLFFSLIVGLLGSESAPLYYQFDDFSQNRRSLPHCVVVALEITPNAIWQVSHPTTNVYF